MQRSRKKKKKVKKWKSQKKQQKTAESAKKNENTRKTIKTGGKRVANALNGSRPKSSPARACIKGARVGRDVGFLVYVHVLGFFLLKVDRISGQWAAQLLFLLERPVATALGEIHSGWAGPIQPSFFLFIRINLLISMRRWRWVSD
jgi:hypothetical protein